MWITCLQSLNENRTWGLLSSGVTANIRDRIIFKDGYLKSLSLGLSALLNFVSLKLIFLACIFWLLPFSFFAHLKCQSVVLVLQKPGTGSVRCSCSTAAVDARCGRQRWVMFPWQAAFKLLLMGYGEGWRASRAVEPAALLCVAQ